jgi:hypothetical protein
MTTQQQLSGPVSGEAFVHRAGAVCMCAGLLGAASGVYLAAAPPQVSADVYSYPLEVAPFAAIQVFFAIQHLALALGLVGVRQARALGAGRRGAWAIWTAVAGMVLLAVVELIAITAADERHPSPRTDVLDGLYGISTILIGIGLVVAGVAVLRADRWTGWQRVLLLVTGAYVFVPMIPAIMGPFVLARLAIAGWMLLFAALGWALLRSTPRP